MSLYNTFVKGQRDIHIWALGFDLSSLPLVKKKEEEVNGKVKSESSEKVSSFPSVSVWL